MNVNITNPTWISFCFAFTGRVFDLLSTRWVSPKLALESNAVIRKFGWKYAWATVLVALVALLHPSLGFIVGTFSLFAAFSNTRNAAIIRYLGEPKYYELYILAKKNQSAVDFAITSILNFGPLIVLSAFMSFFAFEANSPYLLDISAGVVIYPLAVFFWGSISMKGRFRQGNGEN